MQVQQAYYNQLHPNTKACVPDAQEDSRVFIARHRGRLKGSAVVNHQYLSPRGDRVVFVHFSDNTDPTARTVLENQIRYDLKHLKRRIQFV